MANNELFYRAAREALSDDTSISGLVIDLDTAVESYLQDAREAGEPEHPRVQEEIRNGVIHLDRFTKNLRAWLEDVNRQD